MLHHTVSLALVLGSLLTLSTSAAQGTEAPITAKQTQFFEENIRPMLVQHCYACHGSEKQKNGLRVDSLEALLTGGDSGPAITLGKPDESLLIEAIEYNGFEMPPSAALPQQIVDDIRHWISDGAKWPTTTPDPSRDLALRFTDEDRDFWSFQEIKKPRPPRVRAWIRHSTPPLSLCFGLNERSLLRDHGCVIQRPT